MSGEAAPSACPRCGARFACGAAAASPCWCTGVTLDDAARALIAQRWQGCLCEACLRDIRDTPHPPSTGAAPP